MCMQCIHIICCSLEFSLEYKWTQLPLLHGILKKSLTVCKCRDSNAYMTTSELTLVFQIDSECRDSTLYPVLLSLFYDPI